MEVGGGVVICQSLSFRCRHVDPYFAESVACVLILEEDL